MILIQLAMLLLIPAKTSNIRLTQVRRLESIDAGELKLGI